MSETAHARARRDQRTADEVSVDRTLLCGATGCPNRWSVSLGGGRGHCSAHAWAERHLWPVITQEQLDAELERAQQLALAPPVPQRGARQQALAALRGLSLGNKAGPEWAHSLRRRHQAGQALTEAQIDAYTEALRLRPTEDGDA